MNGGWRSKSNRFEPAGRLIRIGQHNHWPFIATSAFGVRGDSCCHATNPSLQKDMRGLSLHLVKGFSGHQFISLHHVLWYLGIARIGRIGNNEPTFSCSRLLRLTNAVVIVTFGTNYSCPVGLNSLFSTFADCGVDQDHTFAAKGLSTPRNGSAMVAIGCTTNSNFRYDIAVRTIKKFANCGQIYVFDPCDFTA